MHENARSYRLHEVFRDFCELAAIAFSNAIDKANFADREAKYLTIIKRYERAEIDRFPEMICELTASMTLNPFADTLGKLFMDLELADHWKGQYFTPYEIASLMAQMTLCEAAYQVKEKGFITMNEPTCGSGIMGIAAAQALHDQGVNYQTSMHVIAQDIDITAVHMTYIQFTLLHIPAIVIHGNTLAVTEWSRWTTPAHFLGGWDYKLRTRATAQTPPEPEAPITLPQPKEGQMSLF